MKTQITLNLTAANGGVDGEPIPAEAIAIFDPKNGQVNTDGALINGDRVKGSIVAGILLDATGVEGVWLEPGQYWASVIALGSRITRYVEVPESTVPILLTSLFELEVVPGWRLTEAVVSQVEQARDEAVAAAENAGADPEQITQVVNDVLLSGEVELPPGPEGPEGPEGPRGPAGIDGADGTQGIEGPRGLPGEDGLQGPPGRDGIDGTDGAPGNDGEEGPQGPPGNDGIDGAEGPRGLQGIQGEPGADGPEGPRGLPGADGADGPAGADGLSAYGIAVAEGFVGTEAAFLDSLVGPEGPQGERGIQGLEGPEGDTGPAGKDGVKGDRGDRGPAGPQGPEGPKGDAAAVPDLVGALKAPIVVAHRGGRYVHPEHSLEGYIASMESGFLPEPDIQFLGDGTMVCLHDATVDRTMTGITGNVSTLARGDWLQARVRPVYEGGKSAAPVFFEDVLDQLGGRTVIVPEIKGGATTPEVQQVIDAVKSRGLEKSVIIQSADLTACQQITAAGCHALLLLNRTLPGSNPVPGGVKFIGASQKMSSANLNTAIGWGATVFVWTLNSRNAVAGLPSGVAGYFSDDPWYTSDRMQSEGVARWRSGQGWPSKHNVEQFSNSTGVETSTRPKISGGSLYVDGSDSNSITVTVDISHINGGFTPESFIMRGTFTFGAKTASVTASAGFTLYRNTNGPDSSFYDGAKDGQNGVTFALRRNGQLQGWQYISGASAANLGTANAGDAIAPEGSFKTVELILIKEGTNITWACPQTGTSLSATTSADGVFTPALRISRTECWVSDVSIDPY